MNEVAKDGLSEAEKLAVAEKFKAEQAEKFKQRKAFKAEFAAADAEAKVTYLYGRETGCFEPTKNTEAGAKKAREEAERKTKEEGVKPKAKTIEQAISEEVRAELKAKADGVKGDADEEALKAEAPSAIDKLGRDEAKRRFIIRRLKLEEINRKCAVIRSFGRKCVVAVEQPTKNFDFQKKDAFEQWMANQFLPSLEKEKEREAVGPWWWRHSKRRQYARAEFRPLKPRDVYAENGQRVLNTYIGWGVEPKQGDWSLIQIHIKEVLANGDADADEYIVYWIAWGVQHPDLLPEVALTLIGEKGAGKGTLARVLRKIFGRHSFQVSSLKHLTGNFNAHKEDCILLVADEAYWGGHKGEAGELQRMITEPTLAIERKGFNVYEARNYIHLLMLAEPGWVIPAGRHERRYAAFDVSEACIGNKKYFKALHHQIENGGAAAMLYDLQHMELGDWHPREICKTAALRHQQQLSLAPWDEWMLGLLEDGELPGTSGVRFHISTPTSLLYDAQSRVPRLRDQGKMRLAEYLNRQWEIFSHGGVERAYHFPPLTEMRSEWDKRFGPRKWSARADWGHAVQPPLTVLSNEKL